MGYELVGKKWTPKQFEEYFKTVGHSWAEGICLHHTAAPSLAQRPKGFFKYHIENIKSFYARTLGWSRGPHLFIDDDEIFGMSSLWRKGIHARSFNSKYYGIEVLGDYDKEDPQSGRGLRCWITAAKTVAIMCQVMKLPPDSVTIKFHRDDPKTSKTCPGHKVDKRWFIKLVKEQMKENEFKKNNSKKLSIAQRVTRIESKLGITD